ncbi:periplasmic substrate-binding sensor histidine kinase response regulator, PBPb and PAS domain-containing [Geotalea daltonii FRC-32]|uniref:histidine kinase n=1 Tax=Geotalea daltonii (strain DSM 22248 / JCM 15807 / FRC-32) TaxID=316067 RepID=B9M4B4_GEODF|nr:transporter substrate-binding domain-containing protein [Geotalea daltonii]ACM21569.1 periplasmic substrate-binding sensor histidine kinase response regulator, PBPb and PAS domain-containing [Geotalea daltonii FRC-32]
MIDTAVSCEQLKKYHLVLLLMMVIAIAAPSFAADPGPSLQRSIRVVMDDNYPPFVFRDRDGRIKGIIIDQWRLWEKKTSTRAEISAMDWADAQRLMADGEFDVIDTMFRNEKRDKLYDFTKPYASIPVPIFFRSDISGIRDIQDLAGFAVGVKAGGNIIDVLRSHGINNLIQFNSYEAIVTAARDHKVNVFTVDEPPAYYYLYKFGIWEQYRATKPLYIGQFHRGVKKGNKELLQTVQFGFNRISKEEYSEIEERWRGKPILGMKEMRFIRISGIAVMLVMLALVLWLWMLKRMVRQRTDALQKEVQTRIGHETMLRHSEESLRSLMDAMPVGLALSDSQGNNIYINKCFIERFGYSLGEITTKAAWYARAYPDETYREKIVNTWKAAVAKAQSEQIGIPPFESLITCKDGSVSHNIANTQLIQDRILIIYTDITEREKSRDELLKMQKLESLGILAGGIAHDFNNVLTGIMGNISLSRMLLDESHRATTTLKSAEKACQRASELAIQLLTFSKGSHPVKKTVSAGNIAKASASRVSDGFSVISVFNIPENLHPVEVDEGQIGQAFSNIAINAAQAMPEGGTFTVRAENVALDKANSMSLPAGDYVRFTFSDTGCGIPEEDLKKVFDPYFTTRAGGSGLGLAAAHSIIGKHGGHIGVSSVVGKGTVFQVLLPASSNESPAHEEEGKMPAAPEKCNNSLLIMDDEEMIRDLATELLGALGYKVSTAADGKEAVAMYRDAQESGRPYSAVIMDLTVPGGMGGKEAARLILDAYPDARLIVSSGYSEDPVMAEYARFGFCAAMVKPYRAVDVMGVLDKVLSSRD